MMPNERSNLARAAAVTALIVLMFYKRCPTCGSVVPKRRLRRRAR